MKIDINELRKLIKKIIIENDEESKEFGIKKIIKEPEREKTKRISDIGIVKVDFNINPQDGIENIKKVYNEASPIEKEFWGQWYEYAHQIVLQMAKEYNLDYLIIAAIIAVLSPGNRWKNNLTAARAFLDNLKLIRSIISDNSGFGFSGFSYLNQIRPVSTNNPLNKTKALNIYNSYNKTLEDLIQKHKVNGPKVVPFFRALAMPKEPSPNMVLDGHAINIWRGKKVNLDSIKTPRKAEDLKMRTDYQQVSNEIGIPVHQLQATTWYVWKYLENDLDLNENIGYNVSLLDNELFQQEYDYKLILKLLNDLKLTRAEEEIFNSKIQYLN